ncbi:MAG: hypothetical protein K2G78_02860 [Muribaculaceae bacterium]|nr:hypothetical protein [Muribaculaceae bacterium]MDE7343644.1 hypothetical protein [Muribaculaceae bacterium]
MNTVITVNPSSAPTGARDPELLRFLLRRRLSRQGALLARHEAGVRMLRGLFGSTSVNVAMSVLLLLVRIGCGVWLVAEGVATDSPVRMAGLMLAAVAVAAGCLCRPIMAVASGVLVYGVLYDVSFGMVNAWQLEVLAATLLLTFAGPGRYSLDSVVNIRVFRAACRRETSRLFARRFRARSKNPVAKG